jgi:hypothetical protein
MLETASVIEKAVEISDRYVRSSEIMWLLQRGEFYR